MVAAGGVDGCTSGIMVSLAVRLETLVVGGAGCTTGMLETLVVGGAGCTTVLGANGMSTRSDLERGLLSSTSLFT